MRKNKAGGKYNGFSMMALDDDATITAALQAYFEASGYAVDTETQPERALGRLREKHYDILLLDFLMTPICGDEVVSRLRAFDKDIFIILLTGHKELAPPLNTLRELDIQGYYEKSNRFDQLELLVESCVKSIRQMRIIGRYRDGLGHVLSVAPRLYTLASLDDLAGTVLAQAPALLGSANGFLHLFESGGDPPLYRGAGRYDMPYETFRETIAPHLADILPQPGSTPCATLHTPQFLCVPLSPQGEDVMGSLCVELDAPVSADAARVFETFAKQAASAIRNARLTALLNRRNDELGAAYTSLRESYMEIVTALRLIVDAKDIYTRGHSDRVSYYAVRLCQALGEDRECVERVRVAGLFHDVGKVGTHDSILTKPGSLTPEEFAVIRKHPRQGANILSALRMFGNIAEIVAAHHERWDGRGYPDGLAGEAIPLEARMISIADAFDAMTSDRHYRKQRSVEDALNELRKGQGTQFDARLAERFIALVRTEGDAMRKDLAWTYVTTEE